jgi:DNA adenine methylase
MNNFSPLRYPGGKSRLLGFVKEFLVLNGLERGIYVEPFAGGGGLALGLLFSGYVSDVFLNDIDPGIYSFWLSITEHTDDFCSMIESAILSVEEWERQRSIYFCSASVLEKGFSTFYLNRTNRSGIIKSGGVLGGKAQRGHYLIDCRFNKAELVRRIRRIARYRDMIHVSSLDASQLIVSMDSSIGGRTLIFADPPYFAKGSSLYTNYYRADDHEKLATSIGALTLPWCPPRRPACTGRSPPPGPSPSPGCR